MPDFPTVETSIQIGTRHPNGETTWHYPGDRTSKVVTVAGYVVIDQRGELLTPDISRVNQDLRKNYQRVLLTVNAPEPDTCPYLVVRTLTTIASDERPAEEA